MDKNITDAILQNDLSALRKKLDSKNINKYVSRSKTTNVSYTPLTVILKLRDQYPGQDRNEMLEYVLTVSTRA